MIRSPAMRRAVGTALLLGLAPLASAAAQSVGDPTKCPWLNPTLPLATRVNLIMQKMTVADEINIVQGNGSSQPYVFYIAANPTLCMPALGYEDGPAGVADGLKNVTQLPAGVVLAATFSRNLALQYGSVIGAEQNTKGSAADLGPTVNIDRDPRWGRSFESLSEDPTLTAQIGKNEIEGIQGQSASRPRSSISSPTTRRPTATLRPTTCSSPIGCCTRSTSPRLRPRSAAPARRR